MRMVVDLPAPLAPRKPKISPCFTANDRSFDGHERAEAARQAADVDRHGRDRLGWHMSLMPASQRALEARFGEPDAGERARASQLGFEQRHLRDEHVGAGGDAGAEAIGHHAAGFGGAADRIGRGAAPSPGSSRDRAAAGAHPRDTIESNSASRSRVAVAAAAASAACDFARPESKKFQLTLTPTSHDSCHSSWRGKMRGFGLA